MELKDIFMEMKYILIEMRYEKPCEGYRWNAIFEIPASD